MDKATESKLKKFYFDELMKVNYTNFRAPPRGYEEYSKVFKDKSCRGLAAVVIERKKAFVSAHVKYDGRPVATLSLNNPDALEQDLEGMSSMSPEELEEERRKIIGYWCCGIAIGKTGPYADKKAAAEYLVKKAMPHVRVIDGEISSFQIS